MRDIQGFNILLELTDSKTSLNLNAKEERVKKIRCNLPTDHIDEKYLSHVYEHLNPTLNIQAWGTEAQG